MQLCSADATIFKKNALENMTKPPSKVSHNWPQKEAPSVIFTLWTDLFEILDLRIKYSTFIFVYVKTNILWHKVYVQGKLKIKQLTSHMYLL